MTQIDLSGRVALVTGGGQGLGAALAQALHRAGADVIVNYFPDAAGANRERAEQVVAALGERAIVASADVRDLAQVTSMFEAAVQRAGGDRHRHQQRRHHSRQDAEEPLAPRLAAGDRHEPHRCVQRLQGRGPGAARGRADRQPGIDRRRHRLLRPGKLRGRQGGRRRADEGPQSRARAATHHGGAIAVGHPIGASGARIITHLSHVVAAGNRPRTALATLCVGGGMGCAIALEATQ